MMMGSSPIKPEPDANVTDKLDLKSEPVPLYVPLEALTQSTVRSIIAAATSSDDLSPDYSQRTLLIFLLEINKILTEIENNTDANEQKPNENIIQCAKNVRQWLVDKNNQPLDWEELHKRCDKLKSDTRTSLAHYYGVKNAAPYFELTMKTRINDVNRSREYMAKFRSQGYSPDELKLYWNAEQVENLCPKQGEQPNALPSHDPSDLDAIQNLRAYPVVDRNHDVEISYINKGIEEAVFDIPGDAQIIVLNFANEQSPGGGYLRHAMAQEEVILYNSDGYRALLDLKYKRMSDGYAIPEFGLAYVRNMCFFHSESIERHRKTDMMVSACYCLSFPQLYDNPKSTQQRIDNNIAKFRAFMCAAVANTIGDGSNTYLLLGPIGTGAFGNDVEEIGECFRRVLDMPMMNSKGPIRHAFGHIWFVSIDKWKNEAFEHILSKT
ncbi:unnamed protein product [Rotaria magnacalcarata]